MSKFNTRLFIEGFPTHLSDNLDITSTYSIADVKDITSIASDYTKTITLPGTANNTRIFNFLFDPKVSTVRDPSYTGSNVSYQYSFTKKAKAVITQDNAVVFEGYAKLVSATENNCLVTYDIQISSELTSFVSVLGSNRLQDLYLSGVTSPYDHTLNLENVFGSWLVPNVNAETSNPFPFGRGYFYPLADYGDYETTNATNFYLSNLRACLFAKTYWDEVFDFSNYTYSSNFINSEYFKNLVIPYKDGEQLTLGIQNLSVVGSSGTTNDQASIIRTYVDDNIDLFNVGSGLFSSGKFTPIVAGIYSFSATLDYGMVLTQTGGGDQDQILNKDMTLFMRIAIFNTSDDSFVTDYHTSQLIPKNLYDFASIDSPYTTPVFNTTISCTTGAPIEVGQYAKILFTETATNDELSYFRNPSDDLIAGTGDFIFFAGASTNLTITSNNSTENNTIEFSQFVIKDVKMVDYVTSILRLFNLYPVQDRDKPRHFNVYTRDEFYSGQFDTPSFTIENKSLLNWTNKLDKSQDVTITPIPNLNNSQLLLSYQPDSDWYNTLYSSLYGSTYGQLAIDTGYEFSQDQLSMLNGIIFSPTPVVQYGTSDASPQIFNCEFTVEILNASKNILSVTGYADETATGSLSGGKSFDHARLGVNIIYQSQIYTIIFVINPQSFMVDRDVTRFGEVDATYYAKADPFLYQAFNDKIIPAIYQTSDQNITRKPLKVNPRILYYSGLIDCNPYYVQYTPIQSTSGLTALYPADTYFFSANTYPLCSHLNYSVSDVTSPLNDLLFFTPSKTFFPVTHYPTDNMFNNFFENQIDEITDKDAKMLTGKFKLNSIDIANRDLSDTIFINGTNYRVNEIIDYKPDDSVLTQVELIRQPFQEYKTATIKLINSLSGTSEIDLSISGNSGSMVIQIPSFMSGSSSTTTTGTLRGVPFGMGTTWFKLVITSGIDWGIIVLQNNVIIGEFVGSGNDVIKIGIEDLREGDNIVITTGTVGHVNVDISFNNFATGTITALQSNGVAWSYVSGSTFPFGYPSTARYSTIAGTGKNIIATFNTPDSNSTATFNNDSGGGSSQGISAGSSTSIEWGSQTLVNGDLETLVINGINPFGAVTINNSFSTANITSVTGIVGLTPAFSGITGIGSYSGQHTSGFTGTITFTRTGTVPSGSTFHARLLKNGSEVAGSPIQADSTSSYVFTGLSFIAPDNISLELST